MECADKNDSCDYTFSSSDECHTLIHYISTI